MPDLRSIEIFDEDIRISCYDRFGKKNNNKVIAREAITNTNIKIKLKLNVRSARLHALCSE